MAAAEHVDGARTPGACANCGAALAGRWCHACGQDSDLRHRSLRHLIVEAFEGLFHLDGRLMGTLPDLFFRPGRLARDYLDGRMARHMPPFRTFLAALVIFIFAAEAATHRLTAADEQRKEARAEAMKTPQGRARLAQQMRAQAAADRDEDLKDAVSDERIDRLTGDDAATIAAAHRDALAEAEAQYRKALAKADRVELGLPEPPPPPRKKPRPAWAEALKTAFKTPEAFWSLLFGWGHQLAPLLLPVIGLTLALVYRRRREIYLYDHLLIAMNLMSFSFLVNAVGFALPMPATWWALGLAAIWTPVNLFQTLRGGYGSSLLGAALKTLVVWLVSGIAFLALVGVAAWMSLQAFHP